MGRKEARVRSRRPRTGYGGRGSRARAATVGAFAGTALAKGGASIDSDERTQK
jgi:hypothetical protein